MTVYAISDTKKGRTGIAPTYLQTTHVVYCAMPVFVNLCKDIGLDTCYSTAHMSQTRDQQCFTISEVAADWHEPMVPQDIMWLSIARANGQLDPRCSYQTHHRPSQLHLTT